MKKEHKREKEREKGMEGKKDLWKKKQQRERDGGIKRGREND